MFTVELKKEKECLLEELLREFPDCEKIEVSSFGADTLIQVVIPVTAILAPVISPIIVKMLEDKKVTAKFDGIEVSGDYKKVQALIKDIKAFKKAESDNQES